MKLTLETQTKARYIALLYKHKVYLGEDRNSIHITISIFSMDELRFIYARHFNLCTVSSYTREIPLEHYWTSSKHNDISSLTHMFSL